jgi:hypothetical protein
MTGSEYDNVCILGLFKSNNNQADHIIVGTEFFKEYYVMFDMTPNQ